MTVLDPAHPAAAVFPPDPRCVREARGYVAARARAAGLCAQVCDIAVLLTSEVVTNAVLHGRSEARVSVQVAGARLRVEVADTNSRLPQQRSADHSALSGRGLQILASTADRWGVEPDEVGKVVWFEAKCPDCSGDVAA